MKYLKYKKGHNKLFEEICLNLNIDINGLFYTFSEFKDHQPDFINVYSEKNNTRINNISRNVFRKEYGGLWYSSSFEELDDVAVMVLEAIKNKKGLS